MTRIGRAPAPRAAYSLGDRLCRERSRELGPSIRRLPVQMPIHSSHSRTWGVVQSLKANLPAKAQYDLYVRYSLTTGSTLCQMLRDHTIRLTARAQNGDQMRSG